MPANQSMDLTAHSFIKNHVLQVEEQEAAYCEAIWNNSTAQGCTEQEVAQASIALRKLYSDSGQFRQLKQLRSQSEAQAPETVRQLEILHLNFQSQQMAPSALEAIANAEAKVDGIFNTFRGNFEGKNANDNELMDVLQNEDDSARRKAAWAAGKDVGNVVKDQVIELVKMRNAEAQRLGYRDYYAFSLANQEINEDELMTLLAEVENSTLEPFSRVKAELDSSLRTRFKLSDSTPLGPWHYGDPFFQKLPSTGVLKELDDVYSNVDPIPAAAAFFKQIGLPVDGVLSRSDLYERPGKNQHAFCIRLNRQGDVRILTNLRKTESWMATLLHELGHAVFDERLDPQLPWLLREVSHALTTEAVALYMERMTRNNHWLHYFAGLGKKEADRLGLHAAKSTGEQQLVFTRWCLVMIHFERALFANPHQDLNKLWWNLVERMQGIPTPAGREGKADWASKIHIATAPVYYQNYLLGEMVATQFSHHLKSRVLTGQSEDAIVRSPDVGRFFEEKVFKPGASQHWQRHLELATTEKLNSGYHAALMGA